MTTEDLAPLYDARYFRTYSGAPYERSDVWLATFRVIAAGIVKEINPTSALDVGCAIGLMVESLREHGVEAYGMDFSSYAIEQVRDDIKAYCWVGSLLEPPTRRYDLVTCFEVLEHLPPEDAETAITHLCQLSDDILFSSSPDDYAEDTHLNVRPMAYWAGLFAKQGYYRDPDFDPWSVTRPSAVRFRRSGEPFHRIVLGFERQISALVAENMALRVRSLETARQLSDLEQQIKERTSANQDIAALQLTITEQTAHLDALNDRLSFMSDREADLRTMLHDAHQRLVERDEAQAPLYQELEARAKVIEQLDQTVKERTAWAERMVTEAEARGQIVEELQRQIQQLEIQQQQVLSATQEQADAASQVAMLQQVVDERTAWAERMVAEAEARGAVIENLAQALEARTAEVEQLRASLAATTAAPKQRKAAKSPVLIRGLRRLRRILQ